MLLLCVFACVQVTQIVVHHSLLSMPEITKHCTDVCLCVLIVIIQNRVRGRVKGKLAYTWLLEFV